MRAHLHQLLFSFQQNPALLCFVPSPAFFLPFPPRLAMAIRHVQAFRLDIGSQFERLTQDEKRYAHHMAR